MDKIGRNWKKKQGVRPFSGANSYIIPFYIAPFENVRPLAITTVLGLSEINNIKDTLDY